MMYRSSSIGPFYFGGVGRGAGLLEIGLPNAIAKHMTASPRDRSLGVQSQP